MCAAWKKEPCCTTAQKKPRHPSLFPFRMTIALSFRPGAWIRTISRLPAWAKLMREVLSMESDSLLRPLDSRETLPAHGHRPLPARFPWDRGGAGANHTGRSWDILLSLITQLLPRENLYAIEELPGIGRRSISYTQTASAPSPCRLTRPGWMWTPWKHPGRMWRGRCAQPSHHFPLGIVTPVGQRQRLLSWAARADRYIIEDDYDSEFRFSGKPIPALQSLDAQERVIYLNTFYPRRSPLPCGSAIWSLRPIC